MCMVAGCREEPVAASYENLGNGAGSARAAPIRAAAQKIFDLTAARQWQDVYLDMSPEVRGDLSASQFIAQSEMMAERLGSLEDLGILEIHVAEFSPLPEGSPPGAMTGVHGTSNVLPDPIVLTTPVPGHVAIVLARATSSKARQCGWLTVVLQKQEEKWWFVASHMTPCEVQGHDGPWFLHRATQYESQGQRRNAFLYRGLGARLLLPGPFIRVPSASKQLEEFRSDGAPPNMPLTGVRPSEEWQMADGTTLVVDHIDSSSGARLLSLEVRYKSQQSDAESREARAEREKLFRYICERFPEYEEAFDGVNVTSVTSLGQAFCDYFPFSTGGTGTSPN